MTKALSTTRLIPAAHVASDFFATLEEGTQPDDLLAPEFWRQHGQVMQPLSKVRAYEETGAWYGEFLIVDAGRTFAKLATLSVRKLGAIERDEIPRGFSIRWRGPHIKYQVVRMSDNEIIRGANGDGFRTKPEAEAWLADHLGALAA